MQINIEIESMVAEAVQNALAPAKVREQISGLVDGLVARAIKDALSPYGEVSKDIERQIKESLPIGTHIDDLANFSDLVRKGIALRVNQINDQRIQAAIMPMVDNLLAPAPTEIKLSELVAKALEKFESDYRRDEYGEGPTIIVQCSKGLTEGYVNIAIDPKWDTSHYSCNYRLSVTDKGEVYSLQIGERDNHDRSVFIGPYFNFDRLLVNLYTCKTKIVIDRTDFSDVYYGDSESED